MLLIAVYYSCKMLHRQINALRKCVLLKHC